MSFLIITPLAHDYNYIIFENIKKNVLPPAFRAVVSRKAQYIDSTAQQYVTSPRVATTKGRQEPGRYRATQYSCFLQFLVPLVSCSADIHPVTLIWYGNIKWKCLERLKIFVTFLFLYA